MESRTLLRSLEEKKVCSAIFLDVTKALDKVWHDNRIHKMKKFLPQQYWQLLPSYISEIYFRIKKEYAYFDLKQIKARGPQGSVLGPILYLLYTSNIPDLEQNTIAIFTNDTEIVTVEKNYEGAAKKLQTSMERINNWTRTYYLRLNENKSVHVDLTYKHKRHIPIRINDVQIPHADLAK